MKENSLFRFRRVTFPIGNPILAEHFQRPQRTPGEPALAACAAAPSV
jgi:hypothetical protein